MRELERRRSELAERRTTLEGRRSQIEERIHRIGERYRMGAIALAEYDHCINELLGEQRKEHLFADLDHQLAACFRAETTLEQEYQKRMAELPTPSTATRMQIAFAVLAVFILLGGIMVVDNPEGMVIYQPNTLLPDAPVEISPWPSSTTPKNLRVP